MRLQEEFVHVDAHKFAIDHGAGHCVRRDDTIAIVAIAISVVAIGIHKETLVVPLVHNAIHKFGLPLRGKSAACFNECLVFSIGGQKL
jgi:hypothetical protein